MAAFATSNITKELLFTQHVLLSMKSIIINCKPLMYNLIIHFNNGSTQINFNKYIKVMLTKLKDFIDHLLYGFYAFKRQIIIELHNIMANTYNTTQFSIIIVSITTNINFRTTSIVMYCTIFTKASTLTPNA